ncbi:MAG TPA: hypothetical protein VNG71_10445 [Pyrinomonadaceae bacterium]|nr:hypothetical protein [Pyrinomonadaceae bacterium]
MTVSIPTASGVPGISGPPDWLSGGAGQSFQLDDVRWRGAIKRTFGSGTGGSNFFRATQDTVAAQKFIYLTFRAAFVQELSDQNDLVYLGLRKHNDPTAMVVRIRAHGPSFTPAGPPSANPAANVATVDIWTLSGGNWTFQAMSPTWISTNARMWLQSSADVLADPNNRWAVQLRIPANTVGGITDNSGPNLGTDFDMWYVIHGSAAGNPVFLADYRTAGTTTELDLIDTTYPQPTAWDEFQLTSGPGNNGGVALYSGDVVVQNAHGEGWEIQNHANNTFVARPRNYSGVNIPAGQINATFRIANWGSVVGDPGMPDFSTGAWDYVPGNSEIVPVISNLDVGPIAAGTNPPNTSPISLTALMNLSVPPKSLHQCVLTTLSGANINFLNDATYTNMNYDGASLLQREAEISVVGLAPFAPTPRDVYLAVEKLNMAQNTPEGTDEGTFLEASMARLMRGENRLAGKLRGAYSVLSEIGGQFENAEQRLEVLIRVLSQNELTDEELDQLFPTFRVHVYHDTGERVTRNGSKRPVLREQSSFGLYVYHEGGLDGWQTSIQGAQRIAENLYLLAVPNNDTAKITTIVQAVGPGDQRIPEDPIRPRPPVEQPGCLARLLAMLGIKK